MLVLLGRAMLSIVHVPSQMSAQCTENVYSMCTFLHLQRSITSGFPHSHVTPTRDTRVTPIVTWIPGGYKECVSQSGIMLFIQW